MSNELKHDLGAYLDGELDPADRARIEQALETDADLKRDLEQWRRIDADADAPEAPPVSDLQWQKTWNGIKERTADRPAVAARPKILRLVVFAAAAAAVVVVAVTAFSIRQRRLNLPQQVADTAPTIEESVPGEGFKGLDLGKDLEGKPLRIDYEAVAE